MVSLVFGDYEFDESSVQRHDAATAKFFNNYPVSMAVPNAGRSEDGRTVIVTAS